MAVEDSWETGQDVSSDEWEMSLPRLHGKMLVNVRCFTQIFGLQLAIYSIY
jgi:hypothetical protein